MGERALVVRAQQCPVVAAKIDDHMLGREERTVRLHPLGSGQHRAPLPYPIVVLGFAASRRECFREVHVIDACHALVAAEFANQACRMVSGDTEH